MRILYTGSQIVRLSSKIIYNTLTGGQNNGISGKTV